MHTLELEFANHLIGFIGFHKLCTFDVVYFGECINSFIDHFFIVFEHHSSVNIIERPLLIR